MEINKNPHFSSEYQKEVEKILGEVKNGNCSTLRECVLLFEELWHEEHQYNLLISNMAQKKLEKVYYDDQAQYSHIIKKINQIQKKPEHYKPLSGNFYGFRRVHIGDFVLIYQIDENNIVIMDYDHHKRIYGEKL